MREKVCNEVIQLGVDVCGFASEKEFKQAPAGFRPGNIFADC